MKKIINRGIAVIAGISVIIPQSGISPYIFAADTAEKVFYVSETGNDSNDGSFNKPFRTLTAARDAVRKINSDMSSDITVYLRGGDYRIIEPIVFDTCNSDIIFCMRFSNNCHAVLIFGKIRCAVDCNDIICNAIYFIPAYYAAFCTAFSHKGFLEVPICEK